MSLATDLRVALDKLQRRRCQKRFLADNPLAHGECGLVAQGGIGDHILVCGLANAVAERIGGCDVVVAAVPKYKFVVDLFSGVRRFVSLPSRLAHGVVGTEEVQCGRFAYAYFRGPEILRVSKYVDFQLIDAFKCLLGVTAATKLEHPRLPNIQEMILANEYLERHQLPRGSTAILCIDAGLTPTGNVGAEVWGRLCRRLMERGITPVANLGPKATALTGVASLAIPLPLFRAVTLAAGYFYGVRSGICDLVCDLECRKTVVYPNTEYGFGSVHSFAHFGKYNLAFPPHEVILDEATERSLLLG